MSERLTQKDALLHAVRSLGGEWDTTRAATALRDAGCPAGDKRARELMRRLRDSGVLVRIHPTRAIYRAAGGA